LTDEFCGDATKQTQGSAFVRKNSLDAGGQGLAEVVAVLSRFLMPPTQAVASDMAFERQWPAGGPWG
jgi:hypothetical protein